MKKKPVLYVDVDGVLLVRGIDGSGLDPLRVRTHVKEFFAYATEHFYCRWLTGWYMNKTRNRLDYLYQNYLKAAGVPRRVFTKIYPHKWQFEGDLLIDKLNSINPDEDFYIVDDEIRNFRIPIEYRHRLILIHPTKRNELKRIVNVLARVVDGTEAKIQEMRMQIEGLKEGQQALAEGAKTILLECKEKWRGKELDYEKEVSPLREELKTLRAKMV